jgi:hypothetical protein
MKTAIIILSDPKNGSEEALWGAHSTLWRLHPNVSRRETRWQWCSMAPAHDGRLN